jgi:hypothetical protein
VHLIVPFAALAAPSPEAQRDAPALPALPNLQAWCDRAAVAARDDGDDDAPALPHERALARALGWPVDAPLPWAARLAAADGVAVGTRPWGLLTPVHWRVGTDAVHLADPAALALDEAASRVAFDAVRPLFDGEGFTMAWGAPLRWYASHPMLATLATASIERVVGRNVDRWLPAQRDARLVRRLQSEVQMLLHAHPLNAAREAAGALPLNSFWLSGCGVRRDEAAHDAVVDDGLAAPALAGDGPAWAAAWAALDASLPARTPTRITLCGERSSVTLAPRAPSAWQRLSRLFQPAPSVHQLLATL